MTRKILPTTEKRNKCSQNIDLLSTLKIVKLINSQDKLVAPAVEKQSRRIAQAVDIVVQSMKNRGRLFYVGAGTSGRLGVLDASECPPTFGVKPTLVQGIIAGGRGALVRSAEGAEDYPADGAVQIDRRKIKSRDVVVGIAACGLTPYVRGALKRARQIGCSTVFITCAPESTGGVPADIIINPVVGPEVITGSTRMKAGTATKMVLNILTTAAMIKLGKVYGNLMVDLKATNNKLRDRSIRIVMELTDLPRDKARILLKKADNCVKPAIVMHYKKVDYKTAVKILKKNSQSLRHSIM